MPYGAAASVRIFDPVRTPTGRDVRAGAATARALGIGDDSLIAPMSTAGRARRGSSMQGTYGGEMTHDFDEDYWETHWRQAEGHGAEREIVPNPYLARETGGLAPGTALDAGCGEGTEAIWLARAGWQVTAVDISAEALSRASERATGMGAPPDRVEWVKADLGAWEPGRRFDLVTTRYAHP